MKAGLLRSREMTLLLGVLAVGLAGRLIAISQPFIDRWSWRQADVAMIARNFYRRGFNIFYPQIDWAGTAPGYVGTEFPLVPFLASLFYSLFGIHEWIGRSVSVFFFTLSVPFFYLLVRRVWNASTAGFAVGIYALAPLSIFSSRSFMPDTASLALSIAALYLFVEWLERERRSWLFAAACLLTSLAILVKLPAISIGLPLLYVAWRRYGARLVLRGDLWVFAALSLLLPLAWYIHAYWISVSYFPYHLFGEGTAQIVSLEAYMDVGREAATWSLTPLVSGAMLVGMFMSGGATLGRLFHWWLAAIVIFLIVAGRGASSHQWYQLPLVPVAAAFAGRACDLAVCGIRKVAGSKLAFLFAGVFLVMIACLSYVYVRPKYEPWALPFWKAGNELSRRTPAGTLVVFGDIGDPTIIYYSGRRGWQLGFKGLRWTDPRDRDDVLGEVASLRKEGASYLVFTRYSRWWFERYPGLDAQLEARYPRVRETDDYIIFALGPERVDRSGG